MTNAEASETVTSPLTIVPSVERLSCPVYGWGDWHDAPLRWKTVKGAEVQNFQTKRDAKKFARLWRKVGDLSLAIRQFCA